MLTRTCPFGLVSLVLMCLASPSQTQVDYGKVSPWDQRARSGPDAKVPGWFYNLGITGLRAQLLADEPKALLIKYVFPMSPADGRVKIGDLIVGAGGQMFKENHRNGYGEKVFGADGPISELARVLEARQSGDRKGKLPLTLRRGKEIVEVEFDVGEKYGTYSASYPGNCAKSDKVLAELLKYLVEHQAKDGSFGDPVHNTFAPLALLASGDAKYLPAVKLNVKSHCREIRAKDAWLINWTYMSAAIVLSEYYLATGEKWVLPELQEVHDRMAKSQYLKMSQIDPKAKKSHPDDFPKGPKDSHGGWGHNPGFEGYGPIAMLTGQGALAYSLMHRCGVKIDRKNHDAAYDFLKRGTGKNGYVWYGDKIGGGPNGWADMGRTGATGIANFLSPYADPVYRERALSHAKVIGKHPQNFPDTHGSPAMGMAYTALAANVDPDSFRKLMDANRWWFTMAQCTDGSFYYQPNRDNAGYGSDSRMTASSVVAFIFAIPKRSLVITGKDAKSSAAEPVLADLLAVAERGNADAQLDLGLRYRDGRGVKRDYAEAIKWLRKAADAGNAPALDAVGFQYQVGWGVNQNYNVAFGYYQSAAKAGNLTGMNNLAHCYFSGLGVDQDFPKAIEVWKQAATKGSSAAAARLAMIYFSGDGSDRDAVQAEKFCRQAADAGRPDAKVLLGEMLYRRGKKDAAKEIWEDTAKQNNQAARDLLKLLAWRDKKPEPGKFSYVEYQHVHQGWNNCGATSCTMLAKFQGAKATQYDIKRLCPGPIGTGTDWADLIAAAGKLGHKWKLVTFSNDDAGFAKATEMLRAELDAGRPVGIDFTMPGGAGHTLTVAGYHLAAEMYVLRDPAHPSPGLRLMTSKDLAHYWNSRYYSRVATERCRPAIVLVTE